MFDRLIATGKSRHLQHEAATNPASGPPSADATPTEKMRHRLRTPEGAALYKEAATVELNWLMGIGVPLIGTRVRCLTAWLLRRLAELEHSDGTPMTRVYGPTDTRNRGGTVAFNFLDANGQVVDERLVAVEATAAKISLRTGCFCNPGAGEGAFGLDISALNRYAAQDRLPGRVPAPLRPAYRRRDPRLAGLVSTVDEVERFMAFGEQACRDRIPDTAGLPPRERC